MINKTALICFLLLFFGSNFLLAQSDDIMYFCQRYDAELGEINCSDRFTKGALTVMVKLASPIFYNKVNIQLDMYNNATGKFEFHTTEEFDINPNWDYIHFDNIVFNKRGIFRVFLLAPDGTTVTSALIEII